MELLLEVTIVGLLPALLAIGLPHGWLPRRRDRRIAVGMLLLGGATAVAGSGWALWLLPGSLAADACVVMRSALWLVTLFTVQLPCPEASAMETALNVLRSGLALLVYGSVRCLVLARRRQE